MDVFVKTERCWLCSHITATGSYYLATTLLTETFRSALLLAITSSKNFWHCALSWDNAMLTKRLYWIPPLATSFYTDLWHWTVSFLSHTSQTVLLGLILRYNFAQLTTLKQMDPSFAIIMLTQLLEGTVWLIKLREIYWSTCLKLSLSSKKLHYWTRSLEITLLTKICY